MIEYTLNIGDVMTSKRNATYACFGLGSCVGLFLQDRITGISGGAHILLPGNDEGPEGSGKFYNVTAALNELLKQFQLQGSNLQALRAKITGGANVIGVNMQTGERNASTLVKQLTDRKIYIAAMDVGGNQSRTARFEGHTGLLTVRMSAIKELKNY